MTQRITRLMAIAEADFLRLLPRLLDTQPGSPATNPLHIEARQASLQWRRLPDVRHGAITLPQLEVVLTLTGNPTENQAFLQDFDRIYQRGGG